MHLEIVQQLVGSPLSSSTAAAPASLAPDAAAPAFRAASHPSLLFGISCAGLVTDRVFSLFHVKRHDLSAKRPRKAAWGADRQHLIDRPFPDV